jgi:hypothetical protein
MVSGDTPAIMADDRSDLRAPDVLADELLADDELLPDEYPLRADDVERPAPADVLVPDADELLAAADDLAPDEPVP